MRPIVPILLVVLAVPAAAEKPYVESIRVTAEQRDDDPQDVSRSLDVIGREDLDVLTSAGEDLLSLAARSPSLYLESSSGRILPRVYLRGLGNTDFDLNANQPVSLVHDGVVQASPALKGFPIFDLERVEVLRGPQGTLFGRNTPAGTIQFQSARPTREFEGYLRGYGGRFGTFDLEGAASGPLTDSLAARLSGTVQGRDDFVDNTFTGGGESGFEEYEEFAGRLQLLHTPGERVTTLVNVHNRRLIGGSRVFRANVIVPGEGGLIDGFDRFRTAQDATQRLDTRHVGGSVRVDIRLDAGTLTSITGYESVRLTARGDVDGGFGADFDPPSGPGSIPFAAETADNVDDHGQFSQEVRFAFEPATDVDTVVGAFLFLEDLEISNESFDTLDGGTRNGLAVQDQRTRGWALFGSARWQVAERVQVFGGLRIAGEDKEFSAERRIGPFGSGALGPITRDLDDTTLSGDVGARYELGPRVGVYGRFARGHRAPNVQGRIVFGDAVTVADTETVDAWELGVKSIAAGGRARVNAAVYAFRADAPQLTAVGGAGNFNQLLNADRSKGHGIELDTAFRPIDPLDLHFGISLNETEIDDPDLQVAACAAPCTVLDPVDPMTGNARIDGNSLPNAPAVIANLRARYRWPLAAGRGEAYVGTDWAYRSRVRFFLYESVEFRSDRLLEGGVRIGWVPAGERWEIALVGRNITDETTLEGAIDFNNLAGFVNEPRQYGVEILARF